jgi:hypothetical protein
LISRVFHEWERRLAAVSLDRVVRPFEWGCDWVDAHGDHGADAERLEQWAAAALADSDRFFALDRCDSYELKADHLTFPSAVVTPHPANNQVHARYFPDASPRGRKRAVLVLPQWNADEEGHVALCHLMNRFGISALRLSLPYHDSRKPPELRRADYIVSSNVGRTAQVCRQAVLDARRAIAWLATQGYDSVGILGTSLGSCLAMLTAAHEPLLTVLRGCRVGRAVNRARAQRTGWAHRSRSAPPHLAADLPISLPRACPRKEDPARLRTLRFDLPGAPVADARRGVPKP